MNDNNEAVVSDFRACQYAEMCKFKEERDKVARMSDDEYRVVLRQKFGTGRWAEKEIELLLNAKRDAMRFRRTFEEQNHVRTVDPIESDLRAYLKNVRRTRFGGV